MGMLVSERPDNNTFAVLRPVRPATPNAQNANGSQPLPEGTITREQRCTTARKDLDTLSKPKVFQDDGKGNLVPLSAAEITERTKQAQVIIEQTCKPLPTVGSMPSSKPVTPPPGSTPYSRPLTPPPGSSPSGTPPLSQPSSGSDVDEQNSKGQG